jgi:hypothetical protein
MLIMKKIFLLLMVCIFLSLSACNNVQSIAPPTDLFQPRQIAVNSNSKNLKCDLLLEKVEVKPSSMDVGVYLLQLSGTFTTSCQDLQVKTAPPDRDNAIHALFGASGAPKPQGAAGNQGDGMKPFFISVPLRDLSKGKYKVVINDDQSYDFSVQ